MYRADI